tara:strand:- start:4157 stop:4507 length:351 start_codon:yes stop_codon:yes gene_type:complete
VKKNNSLKEDISFENFKSLDFLIGKIISIKKNKNKNSLSVKVDVKHQILNVVSRGNYKMDLKSVLGQKVVVLVNIKPFKIDGFYSEGVILLAKDENGNSSFIFPDNQEVEIGSKIH